MQVDLTEYVGARVRDVRVLDRSGVDMARQPHENRHYKCRDQKESPSCTMENNKHGTHEVLDSLDISLP